MGGCPKKFPKGLDFAGGAVVTLVLCDWQQLTGRFIGVFEDREKYDGPEFKDYRQPIDIEVEVEDDREFVILQLTEPAGVVTLTSATLLTSGLLIPPIATGLTLGITSTTFPAGTFVAVNVDQIIYAASGGTTTATTGTVLLPIII